MISVRFGPRTLFYDRSTPEAGAPHFGWRFGSPPGLPGGGITGVRPPPTGGTAIPGSTPAGGHITPLDSESCSLSGRFPVVSLERGATLPRPGEQFRFDGDDEDGGSERFDCACAVVVASSAAAARATAMVELRIGNLRSVFVCKVNVRCRRSFRREPARGGAPAAPQAQPPIFSTWPAANSIGVIAVARRDTSIVISAPAQRTTVPEPATQEMRSLLPLKRRGAGIAGTVAALEARANPRTPLPQATAKGEGVQLMTQ